MRLPVDSGKRLKRIGIGTAGRRAMPARGWWKRA